MNEENITKVRGDQLDEFAARDKLALERKDIKTIEDLAAFIKNVEENYNYDYGVAPRSIAQATAAVAWYLTGKMGITGFQAGFVMWDFIKDWQYSGNECGLRIVNYDDMLYPQHDDKFEKTISLSVWSNLKKQAKKNLEERSEHTHPAVLAHWQSIVDGVVPFGYVVKGD